jgi:NAD(P)-dependent dehydrogenase (short-subunit alcohol dehydrogenase family)
MMPHRTEAAVQEGRPDGGDPSARPLADRTVLVTGGSRGLGAATSRRLAGMGARVVLTERDGHLDVLVANAAATAFKPLLELKLHQIDKTFAISIRHFLLMAQLAYPLLQPRGGRIIAISGADTVGYIPGHGLLAAAKAGMETIVRYLACELGPQGVTAVGVLPGYIDTDSIRLMAGPFHDKLLAAEEQTHPLRTAATPEDASEVVALCCLPEARWLNGQIVQNDGAGIFAYMGRFSQAWAMVPDEAVMPDTGGAPMMGG